MILSLTDDARARLDRYVADLRAALAGNDRVDVSDVERDVLTHIEAELATAPAPVTVDRLSEVLDALGAPEGWVPGEDVGGSRIAGRQESAREDWRVSYLAFGLFAATPLLFMWMVAWPLPIVAFAASFILSRVVVAGCAADGTPLGGRSLLVYPALLATYALLAAAALFWPLPMIGGAITDDPDVRTAVLRWIPGHVTFVAAGVALLATAAWWIALGSLLRSAPSLVRVGFYPFGSRFTRRDAIRVSAAGAVALVAGAVVLRMLIRA